MTEQVPERRPAQSSLVQLLRAADPLWLTRWMVLLVLLADSLRYGILRGIAPAQVLLGLGVIAVVVAANLALRVAERRAAGEAGRRRVAHIALLIDLALVTAFVALYTFEPASGHHLLLYLLVVEGATLFGLVGAVGAWVYGSVLWSASWGYAIAALGVPLDGPRLTHPLIGTAAVALATGLLAERVRRQQRLLAEALDARDQELEWRRSLIDMLAHDLRAPMATAASSAELLSTQAGELTPQQVVALSDASRRQIRRALRLLDDLLDLGRAGAGALEVEQEVVALDALVEEIIEELPDRFAADVAFFRDAHHRVLAAADRSRLSQVLWNLLTNAHKHGGPPIEIHLRDAGGGVAELEVRDRGPGVDAQVLDTMYEPFTTAGPDGSTGLGLWISQLLARAMDGDLTHRREDGWTRFIVRLPAAGQPDVAPA